MLDFNLGIQFFKGAPLGVLLLLDYAILLLYFIFLL